MAQLWPQFRLKYKAYWVACWEGPIRGADQEYRVRIAFYRFRYFDTFDLVNDTIEVNVIDPPLRRRSVAPNEPIPHMYHHFTIRRGYPLLCLYDPLADDWTYDDPIATTIVLWIAQWLVFYELWHATGVWSGPGRHPYEPVQRVTDRAENVDTKAGELPSIENAPKHDSSLPGTRRYDLMKSTSIDALVLALPPLRELLPLDISTHFEGVRSK